MAGPRLSKVTVLLDRDEFVRLDRFCEERGFKKSTLISLLLKEYLDRQDFPTQVPLQLDGVVQTSRRKASSAN